MLYDFLQEKISSFCLWFYFSYTLVKSTCRNMFRKLTFSGRSRHCVGHWSNPLRVLTSAFPSTKFWSQREIWTHYEIEFGFQNWVPYVFLGDKVDICIHWKCISQVILVLMLKGRTCNWLKSKHWQVAARGFCSFSYQHIFQKV